MWSQEANKEFTLLQPHVKMDIHEFKDVEVSFSLRPAHCFVFHSSLSLPLSPWTKWSVKSFAV